MQYFTAVIFKFESDSFGLQLNMKSLMKIIFNPFAYVYLDQKEKVFYPYPPPSGLSI